MNNKPSELFLNNYTRSTSLIGLIRLCIVKQLSVLHRFKLSKRRYSSQSSEPRPVGDNSRWMIKPYHDSIVKINDRI
jgi:hypothetical protein